MKATNAFSDDGRFALDGNSGTSTSTNCASLSKDKHWFYNYNLPVPPGASVTGIEVQLQARADSTVNTPKTCVQLSWDGGATWTPAKTTPTLTTGQTTYVLGNPTNQWGHTWSPADFSNPSFRLRVTNVARSTARDFSLDWVAVRLHY
jgi:hypothetical protein